MIEEMKERDRGEIGKLMKVQKQEKQVNSMGNLCPPPYFYLRC